MKLEQNIPDWNKDDVWKNVEDKLHQKKKRRFLYWWFSGAAITILLVGFLMWFNNVELANTSLNENSNSKSEEKIAPKKMQNTFPLDGPQAFDNNLNPESNPNIAKLKSNLSNEQRLSKNNIKPTLTEIQREELVVSATDSKSRGNIPTVSVLQNSSIEKEASKSASNEETHLPGVLPILTNGLSAIKFKRSESLWTEDFSFIPSRINSKENAATFLWVETGLCLGMKSFATVSERIARRVITEQIRFAHTNAIGIQRFLNNNWSLKFGLAYQTIYEKYEHLSSFTEEEEVYSDDAIVYNLSHGITYTEPGLATLSTSGTRSIIHNNFIHRLSVPLEIAYAFKNNLWSFEPSLGFRFQYFQQFKGVITEDENHFFDLKEINDRYYSNDIGMGLITSLNIKYNIFQKGALGLKFVYERDDILDLNNNSSFSRYETIGLHLGYYYSL